MTQDKAHPTPPAVPSAIADFICRSVAELPDRNSPEDWPEAMLVTHAELRMIVDEALAVSNWGAAPVASNTTAEPAPIQPAGVEVERDVKRAREILARLCDRGLVSMSIPVRDDDEDMVLSRIINLAASQGDRGKT